MSSPAHRVVGEKKMRQEWRDEGDWDMSAHGRGEKDVQDGTCQRDTSRYIASNNDNNNQQMHKTQLWLVAVVPPVRVQRFLAGIDLVDRRVWE